MGTYSYSQGIERACHNGWLVDADTVGSWLEDGLHGPLLQQELPLLKCLWQAARKSDLDDFHYWAGMAHAFRDTKELRSEDSNRARAIVRLLKAMPDLVIPNAVQSGVQRSSLAAIAWPAAQWGIDEQDLLTAFGFTWIDAQITAAVKLVPLGQTDGQRLLYRLSEVFSNYDLNVLPITESDIGYSLPAQSMASMQHETQYSRLYRS